MCLGVQVGANQGLGAVGQLAGACDWEPDIGLDSVRFAVYVKFSPGQLAFSFAGVGAIGQIADARRTGCVSALSQPVTSLGGRLPQGVTYSIVDQAPPGILASQTTKSS